MIELTDNVLIGTSKTADEGDFAALGIKSLLNVARDLKCSRRSNSVEYAQVGLVDGPGNSLVSYCAAVLALADLHQRGKVLVYDHDGARAYVVGLMYLNAKFQQPWEQWITIMDERDVVVNPHHAHKTAFEQIDWKALSRLIK